ncbi:MAG: ATP-binding protein [Candidatus Aenigmarchaeota archaeon]|nr:ATP-binding protein [Candidatus Aenigmarchaeota archaeon]
MTDNLKKAIESGERIGVIGSPSSTSNVTIDILGTAIDKKLVGNLCIFGYPQESKSNYALGQIVEVNMKNTWSEDPTMRGLIRQRGCVPPVTERQDIHIAELITSAVFSVDADGIEPSIFGTVPSTGTYVKLMDEKIMSSLFNEYKNELFYLGKAYGTDIKMPMWFKHFGDSVGGAGEAYHIGIFGKTGSGKSVLAKMMMMGYARHKNMSIFVLDPQGELSKNLVSKETEAALDKVGKKIDIYNLHNLVLSGWDIFIKILVDSGFFERLGIIHEDNRKRAGAEVSKILNPKGRTLSTLKAFKSAEEIKPWTAHKREVFNVVWDALGQEEVQKNIYSGKDYVARIQSNYENADVEEFYEIWKRIANLFTTEGKTNANYIKNIVEKLGNSDGKITIVNLSQAEVPQDILWNESIKLTVINEFLLKIVATAEKKFNEHTLLNSLIVIDEAHRLAPRDTPDSEHLQQLRALLIDSVQTTRKYGLGWMFISQTLASLSTEIISQLRIHIFGFGLAWGMERNSLRDLIGGLDDALRLYQLFKDPQSSIRKKEYPFMAIGPISPLSLSGRPLFFNALSYPSEFLKINFP